MNESKNNNKHLITVPEGNNEFSSRETLRFEGNKIHCSPRDQSLSDLLYSKANGSNRWKTNNLTYYLGPIVRIAMNSISWYVNTDTFREFHSVDNTSLHALPNITKTN